MVKGKNILVTGGAGYIGSHVVRDLGESGYNPVVYDNLSTGNAEFVLFGDFIHGDLSDSILLDKIIKKYEIEDVIHFAAHIQVEESVRNPIKYYKNNFSNTLNLIKICQKNFIKNFVFSSTAAVYGIPNQNPINETAPLSPINPYGSSKMFTERLLQDVSQTSDLFKYIALRYFNVAGADHKARIGQKYKKPTHLITLTLRTALGEFKQLKIFGTDYPTNDGTAVRDYIHIDDLSRAHLLALQYLQSERRSKIFNCGYGRGYSVLDVINEAKNITGINFEVSNAPRRPGDPPILIADSSLIQKELGWRPRHDNLSYILKTAWEWEKRISKSG